MNRIDPTWQAQQVTLETTTYQKLETIIQQLLASQG